MRKSRQPIDLSQIGRMELDVVGSGSANGAPWFSVWLAPMMYSARDDNAKAAEIDLIENYDHSRVGQDVSNMNTAFSQCGLNIPAYAYTVPYCKAAHWDAVSSKVNH